MSENSYKKAGTFYFIGNIFNKGISFLTVPIFTRILSTSDYGIVTTYNSWIGILSMIVGFALHMSVRMAAVDYKNKLDDFMSSIILFVTLTSFGITAVVAGGIKLFHIDANVVLVIICILQAYASATIEDYSNYLMMKYEYKARTALMILPNLISVVLSVYLIKYVLESDLYLGRIIPTAVVTIFFGCVELCLHSKVWVCCSCIYNTGFLSYFFCTSFSICKKIGTGFISIGAIYEADTTFINCYCYFLCIQKSVCN